MMRRSIEVLLWCAWVSAACTSEPDRAAPEPGPVSDAVASSLDELLGKLETHARAGLVDPQAVARIRAGLDRVPAQRARDVVDDAVWLIETGRVREGARLQVRLHAPSDAPRGLDAADLDFEERTAGAAGVHVARLAPASPEDLASRAAAVDELLAWTLAEPATRRVEIVIRTSGRPEGVGVEPLPGLVDTLHLAEQAGIAERPLVWLDGVPYGWRGWVGRPR